MTVKTATSSSQNNHRAEDAEKASGVLKKKIDPITENFLKTGRDVKHPNMKLIARAVMVITETPLISPIENIHSDDKRAEKAKRVVSNGAFPKDLSSKKNGFKNEIRKAIAEWQTSNEKILKENQLLANRVQLLRDVADFIGTYDGSDSATGLFKLIDKYNTGFTE